MSKGLKCFVAAALMMVGLTVSQASAQNLLANPGFESPITFDGPPFIGSWEGFQGGDAPVTAQASNSTDSPRTGAQSLKLVIGGSVNNFAGAFQDVLVSPGQTLTFSGFHRAQGAFLVVNEVRFEWRNSVSNTEVGRTANFSPAPGAAYGPFSISGLVPANADTARIVYAIQSFTGDPAHTGTLYIDDVNASVPEPTSLALLGAGALLAIRRRRAA